MSVLKNRSSILAFTAIIVLAVLWGSTNVVTKTLLTTQSPADILAVRFAAATLVLLTLLPRTGRIDATTLRDGVVIGLLFAGGQLTQTWGLTTTTPAVNAFLSGLYVVITPLLAGVLFARRLERSVWVAVALSMIALAAFTVVPGSASGGFGTGEILTLVSAVLYAGQILWTGRVTRPDRAIQLAVVQSAVVAITMGGFAIPGGIELPARASWWLALLYLAVVCGALTLVLQIWAQVHIDPVRAAIIMCSEPLWTTVFAVAFARQRLDPTLVVGGSLSLAAMLAVVIPWRPLPHAAIRRALFARAA